MRDPKDHIEVPEMFTNCMLELTRNFNGQSIANAKIEDWYARLKDHSLDELGLAFDRCMEDAQLHYFPSVAKFGEYIGGRKHTHLHWWNVDGDYCDCFFTQKKQVLDPILVFMDDFYGARLGEKGNRFAWAFRELLAEAVGR